MKKLLTLFLFLLYSTAFSQVPEEIDSVSCAGENQFQVYRTPFDANTMDIQLMPAADNPEKPDIFTAFWYSNKVPDNEIKRLMTSGHHAGPNYQALKEIRDYGHRVIPTIGGFSPDETEFQLRRRVGWFKKAFERIGWENIDFIILRDEPYGKGFTKQQLEWIVDEAHKVYGKDVRVTFMFTRGSILRKDLPGNLNTVGINIYPFFSTDAEPGYVQAWNYESFREHFNLILDAARKKVNGASFVVTAQIFGTKDGITNSPPWRVPEPETAEWYLRVIAENPDVIGLMFWTWDGGRNFNGLSANPALQKGWIEALKKYAVPKR